MLLQAILVSRDVGSTALISSAFRGAVVDIHVIREIDEVLRTITISKFDALIVDYETIPEAAQILAAVRESRSNQRAITFAVVEPRSHTKEICNDGADFILEKPLNAERVAAALRAAHAAMENERRRYLRHRVQTPCSLKSAGKDLQLEMVNISEGGMGVAMPGFSNKDVEGTLRFQFVLPESDVPIDGKAQLRWVRNEEAGFQFTALTTSSREQLQRWLNRRFDLASAQAVSRRFTPNAAH